MRLKPRFIQRSCVEGNKIDLRQADAVLDHKPDIIFFERPQNKNGKPGTVFNHYSCRTKPTKKINEIIKEAKIAAKEFPYAEGDIFIWKNINKLWDEGINTQIYNVDSPQRMRAEGFYLFNKPISEGYPGVRKDWLFWAYLYLRDSYMANNIRSVLKTYSLKPDPTICIFIESIHWQHIQFLLENPSKEKIWKYYFSRFPGIKPNTLQRKIRERSKIIAEYWEKVW